MIKVSDLTGAKLDFWVAIADGYPKVIDECIEVAPLIFDERCVHSYNGQIDAPYSPSTDWWQGGIIIERERIMLNPVDEGVYAWGCAIETDKEVIYQNGPTALIAAMRCYVASKFGEEVEE